jgi:hypothetical protein
MTDAIKTRLVRALLKALVLDQEDGLRAVALKAFEMIRDHSGLENKRAREAEGQVRFRMSEQIFEEVCHLHGGHLLEGGVIPHTDLRVFQPFMRFEVEGQGVILGLATMPARGLLPVKNKSRRAGVTVNYELSPRLDFDGSGPKIGDIFALLLVARDRESAGKIEEIALGVIDSEYESFLFYETLDEFLSGQSDAPVPVAPAPARPEGGSNVSLKEKVIPFVPPEEAGQKDEEDDAEKK